MITTIKRDKKKTKDIRQVKHIENMDYISYSKDRLRINISFYPVNKAKYTVALYTSPGKDLSDG